MSIIKAFMSAGELPSATPKGEERVFRRFVLIPVDELPSLATAANGGRRDTLARDEARRLAACIALSRDNAERYEARAKEHERREEYAAAGKLREAAGRSRQEANLQEQAGAELLKAYGCPCAY